MIKIVHCTQWENSLLLGYAQSLGAKSSYESQSLSLSLSDEAYSPSMYSTICQNKTNKQNHIPNTTRWLDKLETSHGYWS